MVYWYPTAEDKILAICEVAVPTNTEKTSNTVLLFLDETFTTKIYRTYDILQTNSDEQSKTM